MSFEADLSWSQPAARGPGPFSRVSAALALTKNLESWERLRTNYFLQDPVGRQGGMQQKRTRPGLPPWESLVAFRAQGGLLGPDLWW